MIIANGNIQKPAELPHGVIIGELTAQHDFLRAENVDVTRDGFFIYIPKQTTLDLPMHFSNESDRHSMCVIIADEESQVTLLEEHHASAQQKYHHTINTRIIAKKNATVHYTKIQNEHREAHHEATMVIEQHHDSRVHFFALSRGSVAARETMTINLNEPGAECYVSGLYPLHDMAQHEYQVVINHLAKHTHSNMLYKGMLDHKARARFRGKIFVKQHAQPIVSHQANHHLLLSKSAEGFSEPQLEIYAEDVRCTHGATTGQLDEEALFYLRSRGIAMPHAKILLMHAFAAEVIERIPHAASKIQVQNFLRGAA